jgi:hypothetical protein
MLAAQSAVQLAFSRLPLHGTLLPPSIVYQALLNFGMLLLLTGVLGTPWQALTLQSPLLVYSQLLVPVQRAE